MLRTAQALEIGLSGEQQALDFIQAESYLGTQYLHRRIISRVEAGLDISSEVVLLGDYQQISGGFGSQQSYNDTFLDTALALEALAKSGNASTEAVGFAVGYLLTHQNTDGGWGVSRHDSQSESGEYVTAQVLNALSYFRSRYALGSAIQDSRNYLLQLRRGEYTMGRNRLFRRYP